MPETYDMTAYSNTLKTGTLLGSLYHHISVIIRPQRGHCTIIVGSLYYHIEFTVTLKANAELILTALHRAFAALGAVEAVRQHNLSCIRNGNRNRSIPSGRYTIPSGRC